MTRTLVGARKCTSQSSVVSSALIECSLPFNESHVVLTAGKAAGRRCRDTVVSAAMQLEHLVGASANPPR